MFPGIERCLNCVRSEKASTLKDTTILNVSDKESQTLIFTPRVYMVKIISSYELLFLILRTVPVLL
jgi:hypothetical protein